MNEDRNEMMVAGVSGGALAEAESQRAIAEVQASMILAKRFPRNQLEAIDRIKTACQRPGLAEQALYTYQRGGSDVSGPSIRLAEAIAQNWGNLQYGVRELSQRNGESTVEAFAWDIETNTKSAKVFQVPHIRYSRKGGNKVLEDPRDIYELIANNGARRLRSCILAVIPGDVVETAQTQCEETLKSRADTSPENMKKMLTAFEPYEVTKAMIEKRIGRRLDSITPAQVVALRKILNSLKDGMSSPSDWFETAKVVESEDKSLADQIKPKTETKPVKQDEPKANEPEVVSDEESVEEEANGLSVETMRSEIQNLLALHCDGDVDKMNTTLSEIVEEEVTIDEIPMFDTNALPVVLDMVREYVGEAA